MANAGKLDQRQPGIDSVAVEDSGEGLGDDAGYAEGGQHPRAEPDRAAAEILSGHDNVPRHHHSGEAPADRAHAVKLGLVVGHFCQHDVARHHVLCADAVAEQPDLSPEHAHAAGRTAIVAGSLITPAMALAATVAGEPR